MHLQSHLDTYFDKDTHMTELYFLVYDQELDQRTNDPVNAHLRSTVYTNVIENSPRIGAGEAIILSE